MMENNMKKVLVLLLLVCAVAIKAEAQTYEIVIRDNLAKMNMEQNYRITTDSLVITAVSDNGRTHVNYLNRKLSAGEKKLLQEFMMKYPADSLKEVYFDGYSNYQIIDDEHYPRSIDMMITKKDTSYVSKATNAWVKLYDQLFEVVNGLVPPETKIIFDKSKFNVFY